MNQTIQEIQIYVHCWLGIILCGPGYLFQISVLATNTQENTSFVSSFFLDIKVHLQV